MRPIFLFSRSSVLTSAFLLSVLIASPVARAQDAEDEPVPSNVFDDFSPVPRFGFGIHAALDAATSSAMPHYSGGTGMGVGINSQLGIVSLIIGKPNSFFIRDLSSLDATIGAIAGNRDNAIFARAFAQTGLALGIASASSAFYLYPHVFTGVNTSRVELHTASGAARSGWVISAAANLREIGLEFGFGHGWDSNNDSQTIFEISTYLRLFPARVLGAFDLLVIKYQGVYGDFINEHDFTLGLGAHF